MAARRTVGTLTRTECLKLLGVGESASPKELRTVFLLKAKRLHPDVPGGNEESFKQLMVAYSTLQRAAKETASGANYQSSDMPDYDFKDQKSYKATHSRHHHTQDPFSANYTYTAPTPSERFYLSKGLAGVILASVVCLGGTMGYMLYHSAKDHRLGGDFERAYRTKNAQVQEKFFVTAALRSKRPINF
jgi:curved DNA-binding protein CbpA